MFIKVTTPKGGTFLVNTDKIYCVAEHERKVKIIYTDDSTLKINESIDEIERILKGAEDETESAQQWIPCSERLPIIQDEEIYTFIVTYYDKDSPSQLLVGIMIFHDGIWYKPEGYEVIAWQPLPKPYKEDK